MSAKDYKIIQPNKFKECTHKSQSNIVWSDGCKLHSETTATYLSLSWEGWNKQSSSYSGPSPILLWCCLVSVEK